MTDLSSATSEELAAALAAKQAEESLAAAQTELDGYAGYVALGFGSATVDDLLDKANALAPSVFGTTNFVYLQALINGLDGLQKNVGARIKALQTQLAE